MERSDLHPPPELQFTDDERRVLAQLVHGHPLLIRFYRAGLRNQECWVQAMLKVGELSKELEQFRARAEVTAKRVADGIEYDGPCSTCGRGYPVK